MEIGALIIVRGLVQGVGFRYFAARAARELGVKGYAENLPNGNVEIYAEAERGSVEAFLKELRVGPRSAQVNDVKIEWKTAGHSFQGFEIR